MISKPFALKLTETPPQKGSNGHSSDELSYPEYVLFLNVVMLYYFGKVIRKIAPAGIGYPVIDEPRGNT